MENGLQPKLQGSGYYNLDLKCLKESHLFVMQDFKAVVFCFCSALDGLLYA